MTLLKSAVPMNEESELFMGEVPMGADFLSFSADFSPMPRKPIIRSSQHYYHITGRSNNRENFYIPKERLWIHFNFHLRRLQLEHDLKVGAFVLMDNHFHLLVLSPRVDIDRIMFSLMWHLSNHIRKESGRVNRIFGSRYKWCLLQEESYVFNVYKYIYRNPVKAKLCRRVEDYAYSSWKKSFVETENLFFPQKWSEGELKWLNQDFGIVQNSGIQRSLRRTVFKVAKDWSLPAQN